MIFLSMLVLVEMLGQAKTMVPLSHSSPLICQTVCNCDIKADGLISIICNVESLSQWNSLCQEISKIPRQTYSHVKLKLQGNFSQLNVKFSCMSIIHTLDLSHTFLIPRPEMFASMNSLSVLNLSFNTIQNLPSNLFSSLASLSSVDLSHNAIQELDENIFNDTHLLTALDLSYNNLKAISYLTLSSLKHLQEINLQNNSIQEFSSVHISSCRNLKKLNLHGNQLRAFHVLGNESEISATENLEFLDISSNPLECSCTLLKLLQHLPDHRKTLVSADKTICDSPPSLHGKSLDGVNETLLECTAPYSLKVWPANETSALVASSLVFRCSANGYPSPSVMWVTPWGDMFYSHQKDILQYKSLHMAEDEEVFTFRTYEEPNVDISTTIHIDSKNNLIVNKFRGSMSGNFTCITFNEAGNFSLRIQISAFSKIKPVFVQSLFIGGYSASGLLIIGIFVGVIKSLVKRIQHKFYFIVPLFSKSAPHHEPDTTSNAASVEAFDNNEDDNAGSGNDEEVQSGYSLTVEDALYSSKYDTTDVGNSPKEWTPKALLEYLEDSKGRLRHGMGRKMQRVRKNVQSIKESGSVYVHNIVETGSSAARTMRAGVVMGVETVKYHVQSFKELCGTGDMGTQTISMVSVETDVDSNQSKEIIKQVTFV
ncbi:leucine-rich repeat and fibronectin type-III domain-containing protein 5 [Biomphalaria glabrata]|nr:leucine-rich repeat and fibronectin type-III domain-containing protein 5 [Biomphalaria glabrata]